MSERNYRHIEGFPLGKYRRDVEPVATRPELDDEGLINLLDWRHESLNGRPFLDDLSGHYQFHPSPNGAKAYATNVKKPEKPKRKAVMPVSELRIYFEARKAAKEATERQPLHVAQNAEHVIALSWSIALERLRHLGKVSGAVSDQKPLIGNAEIETATAYSADAIIDLGLCLEEPVETVYIPGTGRKPRVSSELKSKFDTFSPDIGARVVDYGAYLIDHPEGFDSADGYTLLQAAYEEQECRIKAWQPRHAALEQQFPELELSEEVLHMHVPLQEMLFQVDKLNGGR